MRQKRAKSYKKQMLVYNHTFRFRSPYQVIVDDQIVNDCHQSSFNLTQGLKRTLQAEVKVMITQCCMQALYSAGDQDAISMAKEFERRRCNHPPKEPLTPKECIESVVNIKGKNKHRYVLACQDVETRRALRKVPGVPIVHINRSVMVMEPLSDASTQMSQLSEEQKLTSGLNATGRKTPAFVEPATEKVISDPEAKKRKRGPKQPNPLSMKKKKVQETLQTQEKEANSVPEKKRKRKHRSKGSEVAGSRPDSVETAT